MLWPCTTEDMHLVMSSLPVSLSSRQRELSGTVKSESKPFYHLLEARFWENIDMHVVHKRLLHVHECVKGYSESCQSSAEAVGCSVVCITVANQNDFRQISKGLYLLKTTSEWRLFIRTITQPENRKTMATWSKWWWVGTPNPPYPSSVCSFPLLYPSSKCSCLKLKSEVCRSKFTSTSLPAHTWRICISMRLTCVCLCLSTARETEFTPNRVKTLAISKPNQLTLCYISSA